MYPPLSLSLSLALPLYVSLYILIALFSKNLFAIIVTWFVTCNNTDGCATLTEKASIIFRYVRIVKKVMYAYALRIQTLQARPHNFAMAGWGRGGRAGVLILRLCIIYI
jgi:hypothetical protein